MRNIALILSYDGTNYHGFQRQKNAIAIQNILEDKLSKILKENISLVAAGRTDTGVHALNQVVSFFTESNLPISKIPLALNSLLPLDIVITKSMEMPMDFNARFNVLRKTYLYKIQLGHFANPFLRNYAWHIKKLDLNLIEEALNMLKGEHDFSSFVAVGSTKRSNVRTIYEATFFVNNDIIEFTFTANGFLYHQVRNIIGALKFLGENRINLDKFKEIFDAKNRKLAPPTAPPNGLYLASVEYKANFKSSFVT